MDKEKRKYLFLIGIVVVGIISGILFSNIINEKDRILVSEKLNNYFMNIKNNHSLNYGVNFISSLKNNTAYLLVIWILGLSIIGILFNSFLLFFKSFIIGFSIGSIINVYLYKGIIGASLYIFPHHIINLFIFVILVYYANNFSIHLFNTLFLKQEIKYNKIMMKYLKIFALGFLILLFSSFIETFLSPFIIKLFTFMIE